MRDLLRKNIIIIAALCAAIVFAGCQKTDSGAYERGLNALEAEDYDAAIKEFSYAVEKDNRGAEGCRGEGIAYLERGDYEYAVKFFDLSLSSMKHENSEFTEDVLFYKAEAQEKMRDTDGALDTYAALTEGGRAHLAYALMGSLYLKEGDEENAAAAFANAMADGASYDICLLIYAGYDAIGREGDGAVYLENALTLVPETPDDFMKEGQIYTYLEDYQSARKSLNTAIERGNDEAVPLMGYICLMENDISSARALYDRVLEKGNKDALAYNGLAMASLAEGQYDEALSYIRSGLNCGEKEMNESLLFNQIAVYEKELDFEMARQKTEEFLKLYPADPEMKSEYKFLKRNFTVLPE